MQKSLTLILALMSPLIGACHNGFLSVYKIDIQQGNLLTKEQVDKLKIGMSTTQVKFLLGSPLITDTLSPKRWDYTYSYHPGTYAQAKGLPAVKHRTLRLWFDQGKLSKIEGADTIPAKPAPEDNAVSPPKTATEPGNAAKPPAS